MSPAVKKYLSEQTDAATLAFFRLAFGLLMLGGIIRFWSMGWIRKFYIDPIFHFTYFGFSWVKPIGEWTHLLFVICGLSAVAVAIGWKYRFAIIVFFLSFTYIELMDKTTYLNHYYFVSVISFLLIFLPANTLFSVDSFKNGTFATVPKWTVDCIKLLLGIVYFYAGLAKLNSDWLFDAMPLRIWLPGNMDLPLIGSWLNKIWVQYAFSWIGAVYDLLVPFLLLNRKTRFPAFIVVVIFHLLTRILFPIGIFPYIMIVSTLIFFDAKLHRRFLVWLSNLLRLQSALLVSDKNHITDFSSTGKIKLVVVSLFLMFQLVFPFRYLLYPDELFWTEEGYRFSWRVMLMEKAGYTEFTVKDAKTGNQIHVNNSNFLTAFQLKQMAFQPDFILEYAHFLHDNYEKRGMADPQVYCKSYVALNGRLSRPYINPTVNLAKESESWRHKSWILPFNDEIKGL
ncbi:HTTM domain-containing protein [Flavobacterium silvaticum]|uniref:HTTM domain-containing protein n=1 Tax=Flavobacterium silvaticum TaxID=1852020 RepID=A0A972G0A6_9FLAO|nr:HTTM domain-containing protein [Flavobacterium silvaticum]NMH28086.1 HTTM domain-containing protein [Flavobacterium silvaticum]